MKRFCLVALMLSLGLAGLVSPQVARAEDDPPVVVPGGGREVIPAKIDRSVIPMTIFQRNGYVDYMMRKARFDEGRSFHGYGHESYSDGGYPEPYVSTYAPRAPMYHSPYNGIYTPGIHYGYGPYNYTAPPMPGMGGYGFSGPDGCR